MYLAVYPKDKLATIQKIVEAYGISRGHAMKVINELGRHGLVKNIRERGDGLRLAVKPEGITIGEVVRKMEQNLNLAACLGADGWCYN